MSDNSHQDDQNTLSPEERGALYARWFDVSLDVDRQLLTLSTAGLGLLATVVAGNLLKTKLDAIFWGSAMLFFLLEVALLMVVVFFNKKLLGQMLDENKFKQSKILDFAEAATRWIFCIALLCTAGFAASVAVNEFGKVRQTVTTKVADEQQSKTGSAHDGRAIEHAADVRAAGDKGLVRDAPANSTKDASSSGPSSTEGSSKKELTTR